MDEKRITIEDVLGEFGFRIEWSALDHWADFKVYDICGRGPEPMFHKKDASSYPDSVTDTAGADLYVSGYIKWDGCSQMDWGPECSHFCGADAFKKHIALLKHLYLRAPELMGRGVDGLDEPWAK